MWTVGIKPLFLSCYDFADVVLPSVLWAFPSVLPWPGRATFWWEQGELVLPPLQVLSCVRQKKQTLQGTVWLFGTPPFHFLASNHWATSLPQPLLECERCQNCYHTSCLGPSYPKQNKKRKAWVAYQFLFIKIGLLLINGNRNWLCSFLRVGFLCRSAPRASDVKAAASRQGRVGSWNGTMTKDSALIVPNSMTWVRNNFGYMFHHILILPTASLH